jgi:hypothetical protein
MVGTFMQVSRFLSKFKLIDEPKFVMRENNTKIYK